MLGMPQSKDSKRSYSMSYTHYIYCGQSVYFSNSCSHNASSCSRRNLNYDFHLD